MSILFITTGGTIGAQAYADPSHPPEFIQMPFNNRDLVREALAAPDLQIGKARCISLEPRDSKLIDDSYLEKIMHLMAEVPEKNIVITHGTDRILQTADYLYRQFEADPVLAQNRSVLMTGAMIPLANGAESDGYKNIKYCLELFVGGREIKRGQIYIVLCDRTDGLWQPRLYRFEPGLYEKIFDPDGRYSRLSKIA